MSNTHTPVNAAEADSLRAYVPTSTLLDIASLSSAEGAEYEKLKQTYEAAKKAIAEAKERMRKDRALIKQMDKKVKAYFSTPLYPRTDAARDAAWQAARVARNAAIAAGETPKFETVEQCGARVKGVK